MALVESLTPIPLSSHAELERQTDVAAALVRLLAKEHSLPQEPDNVAEISKEIERLRCVLHLGDLEHCRSQERLFTIRYAMQHDAALQDQEKDLFRSTESDRQAFFNDVHQRIKRRDFSRFAFSEADFKEVWNAECAQRALDTVDASRLLKSLEKPFEGHLRTKLADAGVQVGAFAWPSLAPSEASDRWRTHVDALTMETPDDLWFVAEASPNTKATQGCSRDLMLVVDLSGSMCNVLPILKECLQDILAHSSSGDRICLIGFSSDPVMLCDWTEIAGCDSRGLVRACVGAMEAGGGTCIVPALDLVGERLRGRPAMVGGMCRSAAVVLLSDGDPEEPPDTLCSAGCRALAGSDATVVTISFGEESRPDLMALVAQCGRGASLYIEGPEQLPTQLGRMWGVLGGSVAAESQALPPIDDVFLVLEPAEGVELVETERPLGGSASLRKRDGHQFTVLRCGQRPTPGDGGGTYRLAGRLRLPVWAQTPMDGRKLQHPLLRATWVWRNQQMGPTHAVSDTLRVVQVPSLLMEAKLGLPLRVVLSADHAGCADFDRDGFLAAIAASLGVSTSSFSVGAVSPGSIIVDLRLSNASDEDITKIRNVFGLPGSNGAANPGSGSQTTSNLDFHDALANKGFEMKEFCSIGGQAVRRMLQWRLAAALESAARGDSSAREKLDSIHTLASSDVARVHECGVVDGGVAAAVARDARVAVSSLESVDGNALLLPAAKLHSMAQQAHAHCQQLCPELSPIALAVRAYEVEAMRRLSVEFETNAAHRAADAPVTIIEHVLSVGSNSALRLRCEGAAAAAVVAFRVQTRCAVAGSPETLADIEVAVAVREALSGVEVELPALAPDSDEHVFIAWASNGRDWGPPSAPMSLCPSVESPASRSLTPASLPPEPVTGRSTPSRGSRRLAALGRPSAAPLVRPSAMGDRRVGSGPRVVVSEASVSANGSSLSLRWHVEPDGSAPTVTRWDVVLEGGPSGSKAIVPSSVGPSSARFDGLAPSASYRFRVAAAPAKAPAAQSGRGRQSVGLMGDLCVKGKAMSRPTVQLAEGIVLTPPFSAEALAQVEASQNVQPLSPGTFIVAAAPKELRRRSSSTARLAS